MTRVVGQEQDAAFRVTLDVRELRLNDDEFLGLCRDNPDLRLELTANGELIVMSPTGSDTGWKDSRINFRLAEWSERDGSGVCFSSSTGFTLPNGAKRSPDASWILRERWNRLSTDERLGLAPLCPDFVVELRSPSDHLADIHDKMEEYIRNGARLGWLLDPIESRVWIYRPGAAPERRDNPGELDGEAVLPGFRFDFQELIRL
jgi:Uma2 family endonuclease